MLAHIAGIPVEESLAPLAAGGGALLLTFAARLRARRLFPRRRQ